MIGSILAIILILWVLYAVNELREDNIPVVVGAVIVAGLLGWYAVLLAAGIVAYHKYYKKS